MDLFRPIDIYCERTDPSFWAEPINAITNASFILAAIAGFILLKNNPNIKHRIWLKLICIFTLAIGIGSFSFHTFANTWSQFADILPIFALKITFVLFSLIYIFKFGLKRISFYLALFISLTIGFGFPPANLMLNGSMTYIPTLVFLFALSECFRRQGLEPLTKLCMLAAGLFTLSVLARSMDMLICTKLNIGTHFIWHSLNGFVIFLIIYTLFEFAKADKSSPS